MFVTSVGLYQGGRLAQIGLCELYISGCDCGSGSGGGFGCGKDGGGGSSGGGGRGGQLRNLLRPETPKEQMLKKGFLNANSSDLNLP